MGCVRRLETNVTLHARRARESLCLVARRMTSRFVEQLRGEIRPRIAVSTRKRAFRLSIRSSKPLTKQVASSDTSKARRKRLKVTPSL